MRVMALPSLRHRIILNLAGEAEGVTTEELLQEVLETVPEMT
jgi:MoxR-like ATPase